MAFSQQHGTSGTGLLTSPTGADDVRHPRCGGLRFPSNLPLRQEIELNPLCCAVALAHKVVLKRRRTPNGKAGSEKIAVGCPDTAVKC